MVRMILAGLAGLVLLAGAAMARDREIEAVIGAQIEAFRAEDVDRAFDFASPSIRRLFGSPETFGTMVQQGYPMVWRPGTVTFLQLRDVDGALWQTVRITDAGGAAHLLDYQMIPTEEGWKINAVRILQAPGVAA